MTEVTGKNYLELFLTDTERPAVAKELVKVFAGIPTVGYENLVVTRAGATPTFLWNAALLCNDLGQPLGALSVGHDITKRKHAEESLRKSEERLRAFLDNSAVIAWMKDEDGRYVREPTPEEIAEKMELPLDKVRKVLKIAKEPISLETPIGEEEDSHLGDFIEDKSVVSPAEDVINMNLAEQTRKVLKTLTPREEKVLRMRFGIGEKSDHTLEEVGQDFEVTRERIRQIEAKALRKLRHPSRSKRLKAFVEN